MNQVYGYVRVSSKDQCEARQILALQEFAKQKGNDEYSVYIDKQSGKDFNRVQYRRLVKRLKQGDLVVIKSIDRLGRDYMEIIEQWKYITRTKQADITVLDMPLLDTRQGKDLMGTFISDLVLQLLSFFAEYERKNIRERQKEGIRAAKERGANFGRPKLKKPDNFDEIAQMWKSNKITTKQAISTMGISESTFYRWTKE